MKLMDVGKKQHAFRMRALTLAAHYAVEVPEDTQFLRTDRIFAENVAIGEISLQSLQHDDIGSNEQESLGVVFGNFILLAHRIEVLPCDSQRHDLRLAATRGHLRAVAGEFVILSKPEVGYVLGIPLKQIFASADLLHFPNIDKRLDRFPL